MKKLHHLSVYNNPLVDEDDCDLCKAPLEGTLDDGGTLLEMNFVDLAASGPASRHCPGTGPVSLVAESVPVAYFLCSERCKCIVNELKDSEQTNYR
eukprot:gene29073-9710_t